MKHGAQASALKLPRHGFQRCIRHVTLVINLAQLRLAQQNATSYLTYRNSVSSSNTPRRIIISMLVHGRPRFPLLDYCHNRSFWILLAPNWAPGPATAPDFARLLAALGTSTAGLEPCGRGLLFYLTKRGVLYNLRAREYVSDLDNESSESNQVP